MSRRLGRVEQDDDEAIAYTINWAADLNSSTLAAVVWTVPTALTTEMTSNTTTSSSIRLSGGAPGQSYKVECTVTTAAGEDLQAHFLIGVTD